MFCLRKPSEKFIRDFLPTQTGAPFSYGEIGCTRDPKPQANYKFNHTRICLGKGEQTFAKAVVAIKQWRMFELSWLSICFPDAPIQVDTIIAVLACPFWPWSLSPCRIIYVLDEKGGIDRFGFAYGTLPEHIAKGEERFSVEWNHADDSVWYDLLSFSQPNHILVRVGRPMMSHVQKKFAAESKQAMLRAVGA